jgi:hypothetical protein
VLVLFNMVKREMVDGSFLSADVGREHLTDDGVGAFEGVAFVYVCVA